MRALVRGALTVATLMSVTACEKVVTIEAPGAGAQANPITQFRVRFHQRFTPGTFQATLNGQSITTAFSPTPVPGGVSTAPAPGVFRSAGAQVLRVQGDYSTSGGVTLERDDSVAYFPPRAVVVRAPTTDNLDLSVTEGQTITASALLSDAPSSPLAVTLTPVNIGTAVSLNNQPAGASIVVTVPTNDRRANFTIRGIKAGQTFGVMPAAAGYSLRGASGTVKSP